MIAALTHRTRYQHGTLLGDWFLLTARCSTFAIPTCRDRLFIGDRQVDGPGLVRRVRFSIALRAIVPLFHYGCGHRIERCSRTGPRR
jgi:hypothetical protein